MADPHLSPEHESLAAELALGVLEGPDRAEALRLTLSDPAFAAEVEAWRRRLSPLLGTVVAAVPSPRVWNAVEARIGEGGEMLPSARLRSLRLWRGAAFVSGAIAAGLALILVSGPPAPSVVVVPPATSIAVSQLSGADSSATMAVAYDPQKGLLRLGAAALEGSAKSPELWIIPEDGVPRSLGIVRADGDEITVDAGLRRFMSDGATLAITMEDASSAPHKAPSAAPVLAGKFSII
ncbi:MULTISPECIES: anti-sigma factor [unclassified Novosphingobium]|uniref:anti-sigma factor n=1 Tax=unclassified Novosphingobium TaxID=2644732 RepID=UPI00135CAECC|nr:MULTISPECIES: anti-sigma factor [unclassified Novosphingobium]